MDLAAALKQMRDIDVLTVDRDTLAEYGDVVINTALPRGERLLDYISQIKNPYCFLNNGTVVKVSFADTEATMEDKLEAYLLSL